MKNYYQYTIEVSESQKKEILIALLADAGFEGFEDQPGLLIATTTISEPEDLVSDILKDFTWSVHLIPEKNWNTEWESNFHPVILEEFCTIRAGFHQISVNTPYEIIITPKMSFGTGHHATTWLMMHQMREIQFSDKTVLDYGTGTGVLAILAEKMGASAITAIDIDDWSIENSRENIAENLSGKIQLLKGDITQVIGKFDVILANINRNVLLQNMNSISEKLLPGGMVLLSGILAGDFSELIKSMELAGIEMIEKEEKEGWGIIKGRKL